MNFDLLQMPDRQHKPRREGLTMVMDKGLSVEEARNFMSVGHEHVDFVKLGFGTAYVTPTLPEKLAVYRSFGVPVYFGGTLFEAFVVRGQFNDYINLCRQFGITHMEVSDGSIELPHEEKCNFIAELSNWGTVLSEVGSKNANHIFPPHKWIELMHAELAAGSSYLIAEAREAGNVGIYRAGGEIREGLVKDILAEVAPGKIIWEAPLKNQQLYFLALLGANVNLGNIGPAEIIALEAMRIGLRGDSFHFFLGNKAIALNNTKTLYKT